MGEISTVLFLFLFLGSLFVCLFNVFLVFLMLWGDDDVVVVVVVGVFVFSKKSFGIERERERRWSWMPQRLPFGNRRRRYKVRNFSYFNLIFKFWVSFFCWC